MGFWRRAHKAHNSGNVADLSVVRNGSWLCKNAKTRNGDRMNVLRLGKLIIIASTAVGRIWETRK